MRNHPERNPVKGILVLRVDVPLFWVNAASIKDAILTRVDGAREFVDDEIVAVVLDIEGTNQLDATTVDMLDSLLAALRVRCVDLYLVRVMYPVRVLLRRAGFVAKIGEDHMWHTISQGVREARIHYGLKEGVVDASGGYDSAAEEHEPRIEPHYFAQYRQRAEVAVGDGDGGEGEGDGDSDEGVTAEVEGSYSGAELDAGDAPGSLEVLAAARGLDSDGRGEQEESLVAPGDGGHHKANGKGRRNGKGHRS
jgi:hypothetical protein